MATVIYNSFKGAELNGGIDWADNATTTIKAMLVTVGYTADIDAHTHADDITNEVVGTGYVAGGKAFIGRTIAVDNVSDLATYDGDNLTWSTSTITARGLVLYKDTGTPATSPLIGYFDFTTDKISVIGDFVVNWNANGIFTVS